MSTWQTSCTWKEVLNKIPLKEKIAQVKYKVSFSPKIEKISIAHATTPAHVEDTVYYTLSTAQCTPHIHVAHVSFHTALNQKLHELWVKMVMEKLTLIWLCLFVNLSYKLNKFQNFFLNWLNLLPPFVKILNCFSCRIG